MSDATPRPRWRRIARRALKWTGIACGALVGLALLALLALQTPWAKGRIKDKIEDELRKRLQPGARACLEIDELTGNPLGDVTAHGVVICDQTGQPAIKIETLHIDFSVRSLFDQHFEAEAIELDGVEATLRRGPDGRFLLSTLLVEQPPTDEPPWAVTIALALRRGVVAVEVTPGHLEQFDGLELDAALRVRVQEIAAELHRLDAHWVSRDMKLGARGQVAVTGDGEVTARAIHLTARSSTIEVPEATSSKDGVLGSFQVHVDARDVRAIAPGVALLADVDLAGVASGRGGREPWQVSIFGQAGRAPLAIIGQVQAAGAALAAEPAPEPTASGVVLFGAVDPAALVAGAPAGDLAGWAQVEARGTGLDGATGSLAVNLRGAVAQVEIGRARVEASLGADRRVVVAASGATPFAEATLEVALGLAADPADWRGATVESSKVAVTVRDLGAAERAAGMPVTLRGGAVVVAQAKGPLSDLSATAEVSSASIAREKMRFDGIQAHLSGQDLLGKPRGTAKVTVRSVIQEGERLGRGRIDARLAADGNGVVDFDVGGGGIPAMSGTATFKLIVSEQAAAFKSASHVVASQVTIIAAQLKFEGAKIQLNRFRITLGKLVWRGAGGNLAISDGGKRMRGGIELRSKAGRARLDIDLTRARGELRGPATFDVELDLAQLLAAQGVKAPIAGSVNARGQLRLPSGPGWVEAHTNGLTAAGVAIDRVDLRADVRDRELDARVTAAAGALGRLTLVVEGQTPAKVIDTDRWKALGAGAITKVMLDVAKISLPRVGEVLGTSALRGGEAAVHVETGAGLATARAKVTVTAARVAAVGADLAADATVEATLSAAELALSFGADLGARGAVEGRVALARPADAVTPSAWLAGGLRVVRSLEVSATRVAVDQLESVLPHDPGAPPIDLGGTLDLELSAGPAAGLVALHVALDRVRAGAASPVSGDLRAVVDRTQTGVTFDLRAGAQRLLYGKAGAAVGTALVARPTEIDVARVVSQLRAAQLTADVTIPRQPIAGLLAIGDLAPEVGGDVAGSGELRGSLDAPRFAVRLDAPGLSAQGVRFESFQLRGRYAGTTWSAVARGRQSAGGRLEMSVRADPAEKQPLAGHLTALDFDLGFLTPLLGGPGSVLAHLGGKLSAELDVAGSMAAPAIDGSIKLRDVDVRLPRFLRPLQKGQIDIVVKNSVASVSATAASRPGRVDITGWADVRRPAAFNFAAEVRGRELPVMAGTQLVSVSGGVRGTGRLDGRLWIIDLAALRGFSVRLPGSGEDEVHNTGDLEDVVFVDAAGLAAAMEEEAESGGGAALRMTITTDERVRLRGDILYAEAVVDLQISVVGGVTVLSGSVHTTRGWVEISARRYDLERVWVVLEGEIPPDPRLDVRVAHRFPNTTVYIDVVGPLSDFQVSFASDSGEYDQAQLLAMVLSGEGGAQSETPGVGATAAGATLSLAAAQVAKVLKQSGLPIDAVRIGTESPDQPVTYITAGKWVTERLFVAYRRRFDGDLEENANEGVLQHYFARDWMWEGTGGDRGTATLDLLWVVPF